MTTSTKEVIKNIFSGQDSNKLQRLFENLHSMINCDLRTINVNLNLIDLELLEELKSIIENGHACVYFGKSLRDIKCVIRSEDGFREHEIYVHYKCPKKLFVASVKLPHTQLQDREYSSLGEIITAYKKQISDLSSYFCELELIDQYCTVMEPVHATFKDEFRRILLADRVWLHVEVTLDGLPTNIHLVGQSDLWHNKLQEGLLTWDHDKHIVNNILNIFDLSEFPHTSHKTPSMDVEDATTEDETVCSICLCAQLPDMLGVPLPLCQNISCGVYFHRNCLYEWLVACAGSRPPAFGVATGSCPTCLQPIACNEKDN